MQLGELKLSSLASISQAAWTTIICPYLLSLQLENPTRELIFIKMASLECYAKLNSTTAGSVSISLFSELGTYDFPFIIVCRRGEDFLVLGSCGRILRFLESMSRKKIAKIWEALRNRFINFYIDSTQQFTSFFCNLIGLHCSPRSTRTTTSWQLICLLFSDCSCEVDASNGKLKRNSPSGYSSRLRFCRIIHIWKFFLAPGLSTNWFCKKTARSLTPIKE